MSWYLKKADGSVYGPEDAETLRLWAADGRVAPDDQLSTDQVAWRPAPDLPELDMQWVLKLSEGETFGPVNGLALRDLWRDGAIAPDAELDHPATGKRRTVAAVLVEALDRLAEEQLAALDVLRGQLSEAADAAARCALLQDNAAELLAVAGQLTEAQAAAVRLREEAAALQQQLAAARQAKEESLAFYQAELARSQRQQAEATEALAKVREECRYAQQQLATACQERDQHAQTVQTLQREQRESCETMERLRRQVMEQTSANAAAPVLLREREAELAAANDRLATAESAITKLQNELAQARQAALAQAAPAAPTEEDRTEREELRRSLAAAEAATAQRRAEAEESRRQLDAARQAQEAAQAELAALRRPPAAAVQAPAKPGTGAEWAGERSSLLETREQLTREVERWKRMYEGERRAVASAQELHEKALKALRQEQRDGRAEVEKLRLSLKAAEQVTQVASAGGGDPAKLDAQALLEMVRRLTRNYQEVNERADRLAQELEAGAATREEADENMAAFENERRQLVEERDLALSRLKEIEVEHREVLKSFRELNDRYIRAVQPKNE